MARLSCPFGAATVGQVAIGHREGWRWGSMSQCLHGLEPGGARGRIPARAQAKHAAEQRRKKRCEWIENGAPVLVPGYPDHDQHADAGTDPAAADRDPAPVEQN